MRKNKHHIIPLSRFRKGNIVIIPEADHNKYHALFGNLKPDEIIEYLVLKFWNEKWEYVEQALQKERKVENER